MQLGQARLTRGHTACSLGRSWDKLDGTLTPLRTNESVIMRDRDPPSPSLSSLISGACPLPPEIPAAVAWARLADTAAAKPSK